MLEGRCVVDSWESCCHRFHVTFHLSQVAVVSIKPWPLSSPADNCQPCLVGVKRSSRGLTVTRNRQFWPLSIDTCRIDLVDSGQGRGIKVIGNS